MEYIEMYDDEDDGWKNLSIEFLIPSNTEKKSIIERIVGFFKLMFDMWVIYYIINQCYD